MPVVPRYRPGGITPAPLPTVRHPTSIEPGSRGVVARPLDLSHIEKALTDEYDRQMDRFNATAVTAAEAKLAALETDITYNPKTGFTTLKGKNALDAPKAIDAQWAPGVGAIQKELTNDIQRSAFQRAVLSRRASLGTSSAQHISQQLQEYEKTETQAFLANSQDAAVAAAVPGATADAVSSKSAMEIMRQREKVIQVAGRQGLSDEQTNALLSNVNSNTHMQVFSRMLENTPLEGLKYYDEVKGEFTGEDAAKAEKMYKTASLRGQSQEASDRITASYPDDQKSALDEVRKIKNPELRDATQQRVEHEYDVKASLKREKDERNYLSAVQAIDAAPGQLPADVVPHWDDLPLSQREALERRAGDRTNDDQKWLEFLDLPVTEVAQLTRSQFDAQYWSHFDNSTRSRAENWWKQAQEAARSGKLSDKMASDVTFNQQFDLTMRSIDVLPKKKQINELKGEELREYKELRDEAVVRKELFESEKKRPATSTEIQKIINELTAQRVFVDRWGRDAVRLPGTISTDEKKNAYIPLAQIPKEFQGELEKMALAAGRVSSVAPGARGGSIRTKVPQRLIERLYAARVLNDRKLFKQILEEF